MLGLGPGSDLSEESVFQGASRPRWNQRRPWVSSRTHHRLVGVLVPVDLARVWQDPRPPGTTAQSRVAHGCGDGTPAEPLAEITEWCRESPLRESVEAGGRGESQRCPNVVLERYPYDLSLRGDVHRVCVRERQSFGQSCERLNSAGRSRRVGGCGIQLAGVDHAPRPDPRHLEAAPTVMVANVCLVEPTVVGFSAGRRCSGGVVLRHVGRLGAGCAAWSGLSGDFGCDERLAAVATAVGGRDVMTAAGVG